MPAWSGDAVLGTTHGSVAERRQRHPGASVKFFRSRTTESSTKRSRPRGVSTLSPGVDGIRSVDTENRQREGISTPLGHRLKRSTLTDIMCLIGVRQEQVQDTRKCFRPAIFTTRLRPAPSACSLAEDVRLLGRVCPIGPAVDSRPLQACHEYPKPLRYPSFREEAVLAPIQPHPLETSL